MATPKSLDERVASKTFLRDILDATPSEVFAFDADSLEILLVNRSASRELGMDARRLDGLTPLTFLPEFSPQQLSALLLPLLRGQQKVVHLQTALLRADGSTCTTAINLRCTQLEERDCVLAVMDAPSEGAEALRRLHEAEEKYRALTEAAHEAVISADQSGLIRSWNQHAERVFGFSANEIIGQTLEKIMPLRFRESHAKGMERYLNTGVARLMGKVIRLRGRHRGGREIPLEASLSTWEQDGEIGFTGHLRDLSVQRIANRDDLHSRRALTSLSRCNAALLQACSEQLLLDSICRLMVAEGGYPYVWIGFQDFSDGQSIRIVSQSGRKGKLLGDSDLTWTEGPRGGGPTAFAMRNAKTVVSHYPALHEEPLDGPEAPHALGFLSCCAVPLRISGRLVGAVTIYSEDNDSFAAHERVLLEDLACSLGHGIHAARARLSLKDELNQHLNRERKLRRSLSGTTKAIFRALESRDPETSNHQQRVARLSVSIAREMHLDEECIDGISVSACLHDIGKLAVPLDLLSTKDELTGDKIDELHAHTSLGFGLLQGIDFPWEVAEVALQHHEHYDGRGYPRGLAGKDILLEARVVAVADFVDAIASPREYRPARTIQKALQLLKSESGARFDPKVVDACLTLFADERRSAHLRAAYE
ncbi:MAG: PAS domain S-box protein [Planctomycetes bacterium]|nr:PAS domain S-box protein [Planctomycetota bacterium]MCP4859761.1 PAS domain S-box protein [Planctomycetota bacterium]